MKIRWPLVAVAALLVYLGVASTWTVQQNEEGIRVRFGQAVGVVSGGLHITLPYPIERIVRVPTTEVRMVQVGVEIQEEGRPRWRGNGGKGHWLTGDTNIVELQANVLYTVTDPIAYLYGFRPSEDATDGSTSEDLIRATSEAVLTGLMAGTTIESTLTTGKLDLARKAQQETQDLLDSLGVGVRLTALNIVEVNPPERVIRAFNDVSSAKADRDRLLAEAEGIEGTVLPRAQAEARELTQYAHTYSHALTTRAKGEAESLQRLSTEIAKSPQASRDRLWLEAIERILKKTNERIVPPGTRVYVGQ